MVVLFYACHVVTATVRRFFLGGGHHGATPSSGCLSRHPGAHRAHLKAGYALRQLDGLGEGAGLDFAPQRWGRKGEWSRYARALGALQKLGFSNECAVGQGIENRVSDGGLDRRGIGCRQGFDGCDFV